METGWATPAIPSDGLSNRVMRLDPESALLLGWDNLQKALASLAQTSLGRTLCLSRQPMDDPQDILREQSRHRQLKSLIDRGKNPPLDAVDDIETHLLRVEKGGVLEPEAIIEVAKAMGVSSRLRHYLMVEGGSDKTEAPSLRSSALVDMARGSHDLASLGRDLAAAFGPDGRLRDSASADLFSLRKKAESLADSIRNKLERMIRTTRVAAALSDPIVTVRADRYVLPVRSDSRSEIKGIVHDTSQTGATLFIEPSSVIDDGNRLKIARAAVAEEERKILSEYSMEISRSADSLRDNLRMMAGVDMLNASVRLAAAMDAMLPELTTRGFYLKDARHPLMVLRGEDVVSNDVQLPEEASALVLSGPNAGGKTVALKTLGLCCLMAQAGLAIPAYEGSRVGTFKHVAAVIGDAQDIASGLSTFSAHIKAIVEILEQATDSSLVLLDELAADTEPHQGAALASAILKELVEKGACVVATTHYEGLKLLAFEDHRFSNASVGFDLKHMRPTFSLHADTPGRSLTLDIARRIGMPESVLRRAADGLQNDERDMEHVLDELENERQRISSMRDELIQAKNKALQEATEHRQARQRLERKELELKDKAREEILSDISKVRKQVSQVIEELRSDTHMGSAVAASHKLIEMQNSIQDEISSEKLIHDDAQIHGEIHGEIAPDTQNRKDLEPGDLVKVKNLGKTGRVISVDRRGHMLTVALGSIRTRVTLEQIVPVKKATGKSTRQKNKASHGDKKLAKQSRGTAPIKPVEVRSTGNTLDLRGKRVDDALSALDGFLDGIFARGQASAFIVHGHGTGALKAAVREYLMDSPYAHHFRSGLPEEGGDGVTVVAMR